MTFQQFCSKYKVTWAERKELAWHLAMLRLRRTLGTLLRGF